MLGLLLGLPGSAARLRAATLLLHDGAELRIGEGSVCTRARVLRSVSAVVVATVAEAEASTGVRSF